MVFVVLCSVTVEKSMNQAVVQNDQGLLLCPADADNMLQVLFHWACVNCLAAVIFHKTVKLTLHELYMVYKMII